jgi:hypothetical protein
MLAGRRAEWEDANVPFRPEHYTRRSDPDHRRLRATSSGVSPPAQPYATIRPAYTAFAPGITPTLIRRGLHLVSAEWPRQDGDLMPQSQNLHVLVPVPTDSSRSAANAFVTVRLPTAAAREIILPRSTIALTAGATSWS